MLQFRNVSKSKISQESCLGHFCLGHFYSVKIVGNSEFLDPDPLPTVHVNIQMSLESNTRTLMSNVVCVPFHSKYIQLYLLRKLHWWVVGTLLLFFCLFVFVRFFFFVVVVFFCCFFCCCFFWRGVLRLGGSPSVFPASISNTAIVN